MVYIINIKNKINWLKKTFHQEIRWNSLAGYIQASALLSILPCKHNRLVLDLGCGKGHISIEMANIGNKIVALDISMERVKYLKLHAVNLGMADRIFPVVGSALYIPILNESFDNIICNSVIEHITDDKQALQEISRVITDNGILGLTVPNKNIRFGSKFTYFWKFILTTPYEIKKMFIQKEIARLNKLEDIRFWLEEYFSHEHLYTSSELYDILQDDFLVMDFKYYMQFIGAICHDFRCVFKGLNGSVILYLMKKLSLLDTVIENNNIEGKGFVLILNKKPKIST